MVRPITLALLTALLGGCGNTDTTTTAFDPAQAPAQPQAAQAQERELAASFADGSGKADIRLIQVGSQVSGTALVSRTGAVTAKTDGEPRLHQVTGQLRGDQVSLRLTPDAVNATTGTLTVAGQLGGAGSYSDRTTGASGPLRVTETIGRKPTFPIILKAVVPGSQLEVNCEFVQKNTYTLTGYWSSTTRLGPDRGVTSGNCTLVGDGPNAVIFLGPQAGTFNFQVVRDAKVATLGPDCDFYLPTGPVEDVKGVVVVVSN